MSAKKRQRMPTETSALTHPCAIQPVNSMKFPAQVAWMSMDAKSRTCAYQEEGTITTNFVQFIVLENAQILSSCVLEVPTLMVARNLIRASVEVQNLVVATKVICALAIALFHVDSMNLNVPVNSILATAVKQRKYAGVDVRHLSIWVGFQNLLSLSQVSCVTSSY